VHETRLPTRWVDFDALAHVTHAVYPVFLDEAWDDFLSSRLGSFSDWPYVLVHVSIDYRRELRHPTPEVLVRTRVVEVGRTSVTFEQEVCGPDGTPAASARCVIAAWDAGARATRAITAAERAKLLAASP